MLAANLLGFERTLKLLEQPPLLVVQGANDPRVNKRESDQIVVALRDRNYPVEYLVAPDEGHGFARPVNNMAMIAASERFLAKHIGGRFQESMSPEVAKRLAEITVDPKTVSLGTTSKKNEFIGPATVDVNGKWTLSGDAPGQTVDVVLDLVQNGETLTGTMNSTAGGGNVTKGSVSGKVMKLTINADIQGQPTQLEVEGTIDGDKITGAILAHGLGSFSFVGSKFK